MFVKLLVLAIVGTAYASAGSVTWTFQNAVFDDGGNVTGSFTAEYNNQSSVPSLSNITIASSTVGSFLGMSYSVPFSANAFMFTPSGGPTVWGIELWAQDGAPINHRLLVNFESPFTEAGGITVAILPGHGPQGQDPNNYSFEELAVGGDPIRYLTSGTITADASTPEPASFALFFGGLVFLGLLNYCRLAAPHSKNRHNFI